LKTGKKIWEVDTRTFVTPAIGDGVVVSQVNHFLGGRKMAGLDIETGKTLWEYDSDVDFPYGVLLKNYVFLVESRRALGELVAVDLKTGKKIISVKLDGTLARMPFLADGKLYTFLQQRKTLLLRSWDPATGKVLGEVKVGGIGNSEVLGMADGEVYLGQSPKGSELGFLGVVR
jgi:outer membrane protein assembly factor BamB